uniref:Uncharacterized protein n=1 Tax=Cacopsylla melanoneura TaxID=428564 RepID=A0A8D8R5G3_9HEMI
MTFLHLRLFVLGRMKCGRNFKSLNNTMKSSILQVPNKVFYFPIIMDYSFSVFYDLNLSHLSDEFDQSVANIIKDNISVKKIVTMHELQEDSNRCHYDCAFYF